jgi:signal transduction histidine kinase
LALAILLPVLLAAGALRGRPSYALTACGDLTQFFLLGTAAFFFLRRGILSQGTSRTFWLLMALGFAMLAGNLCAWIYYEVWLRQPAALMPVGDFLLFIKIVPMLAALALGPEQEEGQRPRLLDVYDLTSLLVYWTYLYLFWAMAYLIATNDLRRYDSQAEIVDGIGNQVFLLLLGFVAYRSRGAWRRFYWHFFGASAVYALASLLVNSAIDSGSYYTGSLYDVPLNAAMAWYVIIAIRYTVEYRVSGSRNGEGAKRERRASKGIELWPARLSMLATLSTPVIGLWLLMRGDFHDPVRQFRILITFTTLFLLTIVLFLKQDLLSFRLGGYLHEVSAAYSNVRRFEDQLVQNEKLASLGKLVARLANEIHRAMSAVVNDVEELGRNPAPEANRHRMTLRIGEAARRTNSVVEGMLSFAQEKSVQRTAVSIRPLLESALNLTRAQRRHAVRVEIEEHNEVPMVQGDPHQLMQVFLHLIDNAIDAMEGNEAALLNISIRAQQERIEIGFVDRGQGLKDPHRVFEPFYTTKEVGKGVGLGLSTCYGIIRQHGGEIDCCNGSDGGAVFKLLLPAVATAKAKVEAVL